MLQEVKCFSEVSIQPVSCISCGHLAVRIDEFPTTMQTWPMTPPVNSEYPPDCWAPELQAVSSRTLHRAVHGPQVPLTSNASTTAMASTLACAADPSQHVHRPGDHDGEALQLYTSMRANLRDKILTTHVLQGPANVMLTSYAAGVMKKEMGTNFYEKDPETCNHPRGFRNYGAGGVSVKICDMCGFRGVVMPNHSLHKPEG